MSGALTPHLTFSPDEFSHPPHPGTRARPPDARALPAPASPTPDPAGPLVPVRIYRGWPARVAAPGTSSPERPALPPRQVLSNRANADGEDGVNDVPEPGVGHQLPPPVRRWLAQEAVSGPQPVTVEHLTVFAETFADLADAEIMKGAWD